MTTDANPSSLSRAWLGILGLLIVLLLSEAALSFQWRMQHDTPLLHYVAFLIDQHDRVPYRDVFETSMVGTFLFHLGIVKLVGYGDLAFRSVDIAWLTSLLLVTWLAMRPLLGAAGALVAPTLFGLLYLGEGPSMSLQRDYLGILPIAIAVLLATRNPTSKRRRLVALGIGALFAVAASIKPQLAIGLPAVLAYLLLRERSPADSGAPTRSGRALGTILLMGLGFVTVLALPFAWLWRIGGLPHFWEMFTSYLPLHLHLTGSGHVVFGVERWIYLFQSYQELGGWQSLLIPTVCGVAIGLPALAKDDSKRSFVLLLLALLALYSVVPILGGKFWRYHWMPFVYFGSLCASLIVLPLSANRSSFGQRVVCLVVFAIFLAITVRPARDFLREVSGITVPPPKMGRVDEVADFLKANLRPGDAVQPLDWAGGTLHGMLLARAVVATPYIYDYHFYHHVSSPYIQRLRREFIEQLKRDRPRFIVDMAVKSTPAGADTTREFPALRNFIAKNYVAVYQGRGFRIFESGAAPAQLEQ